VPGLKSDPGGVGFSKVVPGLKKSVPGLNPGDKSHPGGSEYEQVYSDGSDDNKFGPNSPS
jgi:hypothetical protein